MKQIRHHSSDGSSSLSLSHSLSHSLSSSLSSSLNSSSLKRRNRRRNSSSSSHDHQAAAASARVPLRPDLPSHLQPAAASNGRGHQPSSAVAAAVHETLATPAVAAAASSACGPPLPQPAALRLHPVPRQLQPAAAPRALACWPLCALGWRPRASAGGKRQRQRRRSWR